MTAADDKSHEKNHAVGTWCCARFTTVLGHFGRSGISIVPGWFMGRRMFLFACQTMESEVIECCSKSIRQYALRSGEVGVEAAGFPLMGFLCIDYCPYCGKRLKDIIDDRVSAFDALYKQLPGYLRYVNGFCSQQIHYSVGRKNRRDGERDCHA